MNPRGPARRHRSPGCAAGGLPVYHGGRSPSQGNACPYTVILSGSLGERNVSSQQLRAAEIHPVQRRYEPGTIFSLSLGGTGAWSCCVLPAGRSEVCVPLAPGRRSLLRVAAELSPSAGRTPWAEPCNARCTRAEPPQRRGVFTLSFVRAAQLADNLGVFKYSERLCPGPVFPRGSYSWILFLHLSFLLMRPVR